MKHIFLQLFIPSFTFILIIVLLCRRKFCDGHIIPVQFLFYNPIYSSFALQEVDPIVADDLVYNASYPLQSRNYDKVLNKRYLKCLTEPTKPFCLLSANKRLEVFRSKGAEQPSVEEIENRLHNVRVHLKSVFCQLYKIRKKKSTVISCLYPAGNV